MHWLFLFVLLLVLLAIDPPVVMMLFGLCYVTIGLAVTVWRRRDWRAMRAARKAAGGADSEKGDEGE
jgi:hypothetical protein